MTAAVCALLLGVIALVQSVRLLIADGAARMLAAKLARRNEQYLALGLAIERAHVAVLGGNGTALLEAVREANRVMAAKP